MNIHECLKQFRDDLIAWAVTNIDVKVPMSRKINGKDLTEDIELTVDDIGAEPEGTVSIAKQEVISTVTADATNKANQALIDSKAYTDTKIDEEISARNSAIAAAKNQAISTAANDATAKANKAYNDAVAYADKKSSINDDTVSYTETWSSKKINEMFTAYGNRYSLAQTQILNTSKKIGDLSNLETQNTLSLVDAINEVFQLGSSVKSQIVTALNQQGHNLSSSTSWDYMCDLLKNYYPSPVYRPEFRNRSLWTITENIDNGCDPPFVVEGKKVMLRCKDEGTMGDFSRVEIEATFPTYGCNKVKVYANTVESYDDVDSVTDITINGVTKHITEGKKSEYIYDIDPSKDTFKIVLFVLTAMDYYDVECNLYDMYIYKE